MAVASAGPYANNMHLASDREPHQHLITHFLQTGCSSWRPTNSVRALKAIVTDEICSNFSDCEMQVTLMRSEPGEDHAPTKFSISEVQGDRSSCKLQLPPLYCHVQCRPDGFTSEMVGVYLCLTCVVFTRLAKFCQNVYGITCQSCSITSQILTVLTHRNLSISPSVLIPGDRGCIFGCIAWKYTNREVLSIMCVLCCVIMIWRNNGVSRLNIVSTCPQEQSGVMLAKHSETFCSKCSPHCYWCIDATASIRHVNYGARAVTLFLTSFVSQNYITSSTLVARACLRCNWFSKIAQ